MIIHSLITVCLWTLYVYNGKWKYLVSGITFTAIISVTLILCWSNALVIVIGDVHYHYKKVARSELQCEEVQRTVCFLNSTTLQVYHSVVSECWRHSDCCRCVCARSLEGIWEYAVSFFTLLSCDCVCVVLPLLIFQLRFVSLIICFYFFVFFFNFEIILLYSGFYRTKR